MACFSRVRVPVYRRLYCLSTQRSHDGTTAGRLQVTRCSPISKAMSHLLGCVANWLRHSASNNFKNAVAWHCVQILILVMPVLHVRDVQLSNFCALDLCVAPGFPCITIIWLRAVAPIPIYVIEALVIVVAVVQHCTRHHH